MGNVFTKFAIKNGEPTRICMLGLDAAGKTTVLNQLKFQKTVSTLPTIGFNVETVTPVKGLTLTIWDVGGQDKIRQLWNHYYTTTQGLIFVVDSADASRFPEAASELSAILQEDHIRKIPIVILANKQDQPEAITAKEMEGVLQLDSFPSEQTWHIQECCAIEGTGINEAMTILAKFLKHPKKDSASTQAETGFSSSTKKRTATN